MKKKDEKSNEDVLNDLEQSKFEEKVIKTMEEGENINKIAKRGYMKAVSKVKIQIQLLKGNIIEKEVEIEEEHEKLLEATFNVEFDMRAYDSISLRYDKLKDELEDYKATLVNREELLVQWA